MMRPEDEHRAQVLVFLACLGVAIILVTTGLVMMGVHR